MLGIDASATLDKTIDQVTRIARSTAAKIGLGRELRDDEITILDGYSAGTYGIPDAQTIDAIRTSGASKACSPTRSMRASRWPGSSA